MKTRSAARRAAVILLLTGFFSARATFAADTRSPFRFFSGQVGVATLLPNSGPGGAASTTGAVFGPYAAFTPQFDFGALGIRLEAGTSELRLADNVAFLSFFWGGYVRFPIAVHTASVRNNVYTGVSIHSFQLEIGGGMETWWARSNGFQPEVSANLLLVFHSYIDRVTLGYTAILMPGNTAGVFKAGIGFAL